MAIKRFSIIGVPDHLVDTLRRYIMESALSQGIKAIVLEVGNHTEPRYQGSQSAYTENKPDNNS